RRNRFVSEYGLSLYDANLLTASKALADYEEEFVAEGQSTALAKPEIPKLGSNWLLGEVSRIMNANNIDIDTFKDKVSPGRLVELTVLNSQGTVSAATAKSVLEAMFRTGKSAAAIVSEQGLGQISDAGEIEGAIAEVIAANAQAVADFRVGKEPAIKFLVGQVMRLTKGRANPQVVTELLKKRLREE
ncbi:MAG: Asp-tRNA(Asn)/Glu-tRNA(Gln) amidotransferase GatCAB subunit B, partial [Dehalococcoidales bacterium]|nr:Asp-tRNA(Asn)/Glu-tRNA(Gln) amidotransferase GatCAB subunit B [Dehalococcoidales bacterium]